MQSPFVPGRFRHGDHELAYEIHGPASGTPCLLMHGLLLDSGINREIARRMVAEGYRVVLLDLLGHGKSDKPSDPREHRIDFYADSALALMDHLGMEKALVGGVSLGAITTLQMADRAPERCLGLFLEMPVMEWSTTFAAILLVPVIGVVDYTAFLYRPIARALRKLPRPRHELAATMLDSFSNDPEAITAVLHGILVGPVVPPAKRRRQLAMPALVIGHGADRLHALRDAVALARELPNAKLLRARSVLELRTKPERLWKDIGPFLRTVRARATAPAARVPIKAA